MMFGYYSPSLLLELAKTVALQIGFIIMQPRFQLSCVYENSL